MLPDGLRPMGERVLVALETEKDEVTKSGLVLANVKKDDMTAKIIAVGPGRTTKKDVLVPLSLYVNDVILFPKSAMHEVTVNGKKYGVIKESDVYGFVQKDI